MLLIIHPSHCASKEADRAVSVRTAYTTVTTLTTPTRQAGQVLNMEQVWWQNQRGLTEPIPLAPACQVFFYLIHEGERL
jgi:hypothetical protein